MATNIYPYRESVWYSDKPTHRWGWHLSTSSDDRSLAMLVSKKAADKLVRIVLKKMVAAGFEPTHTSGFPGETEALFVLAHYAGGDDQGWFYDVVVGMAPERTDLWDFLMGIVHDPEIAKLLNQ